MTINLSPLLSEDAFDYSASRAELGDNAGQITWSNAKQAPVYLKTPEELEAFRDWVADFGFARVKSRGACNPTFPKMKTAHGFMNSAANDQTRLFLRLAVRYGWIHHKGNMAWS